LLRVNLSLTITAHRMDIRRVPRSRPNRTPDASVVTSRRDKRIYRTFSFATLGDTVPTRNSALQYAVCDGPMKLLPRRGPGGISHCLASDPTAGQQNLPLLHLWLPTRRGDVIGHFAAAGWSDLEGHRRAQAPEVSKSSGPRSPKTGATPETGWAPSSSKIFLYSGDFSVASAMTRRGFAARPC